MIVRDYQARAIDNTIASIKRNPILVLPTGAGKTFTAAEIIRHLNVPTLWLAHREELIYQAAGALDTSGIIMAGHPAFPLEQIQVASVQTLINRSLPEVELVVIDECHHATADTYRSIIDAYTCPIMGLTATPFRLDGSALGDVGFREIIVGAYVDELVEQGYLHAPRVFAGQSPDMQGCRIVMGDFSKRDLADRSNRPDLIGDIVTTWMRRALGKRTICFAVDVNHSQSIVDDFLRHGVPAEHIDANTKNRHEIWRRLRTGETLIVVNVGIATEGLDIPELQCAIIARKTESLNLHLQMIGRIMRLFDGKSGAIVLDHAGNHHRHGPVTRRLEYSLEGKVKVQGEPLGLRRCQACQFLFDPKLTHCPDCGWEVPKSEPREIQTAEGDLHEHVEDFIYRAQAWRAIEDEREESGFKEGWSAYRYKERFGHWPLVAFGNLVNPFNASIEEKRAIYESFLCQALERGFKEGWASYKYKEIFGLWPCGFVTEVKSNFGLNDGREEIRQRYNNARSA